MDQPKTLSELTNAELRAAYKASVPHVVWSPNNYREEIARRSQDRWTAVIGIATVVNVLVQIFTALHHSP